MTEHGKYLNSEGEFNAEQFQGMMRGELWRFSRRQLSNVLKLNNDDQFKSTILMLKLMEAQTRFSFDEVLRLLRSEPGRHNDAGVARRGSGSDALGGAGSGELQLLQGGAGGGVEKELLHQVLAMLNEVKDKIDCQEVKMDQHTRRLDEQADTLAYLKAANNPRNAARENAGTGQTSQRTDGGVGQVGKMASPPTIPPLRSPGQSPTVYTPTHASSSPNLGFVSPVRMSSHKSPLRMAEVVLVEDAANGSRQASFTHLPASPGEPVDAGNGSERAGEGRSGSKSAGAGRSPVSPQQGVADSESNRARLRQADFISQGLSACLPVCLSLCPMLSGSVCLSVSTVCVCVWLYVSHRLFSLSPPRSSPPCLGRRPAASLSLLFSASGDDEGPCIA